MKPTALLGVLIVLAAAGAVWLLALRGPPPITLTEATLMQMGAPGSYGLSLKIANEGGPDRLLSVQSAEAERVMVMGASTEAGLPVPAGATPSLSADGVHGMLMGLGDGTEGRLVPVTLVFESAGEVSTRARIAGGGAMDHGASYAVPPAEPAPTIAVSVTRDGDGWAATVETTDFRFARDLVDGPHEPGTGHGHVYLGGLKLQRLYEPGFRVGALPPGDYELRVTLNTNDHRTYMVEGAPVTASVRVGTE